MIRGRIPGIFVLLVLILGTALLPRPTHADPHAVFYTAIGQRQLFFNFLAALDQADYVEPATGNFSREALLEARNQTIIAEIKELNAKLPPEKRIQITEADLDPGPVLNSTRTNLSALVTRPVTLEGNDMFTSWLDHEHIKEVVRRAGTAALLNEVFCQQALGRDGCGDDADNLKNQDRGFITDPLKWAAFPVTHGLTSALLSGTSFFADIKDNVNKSEHWQPGLIGNPAIAQLQKKVAGTNAEKLVERSVLSTFWSSMPLSVDPNLYDGITLDDNGNVQLAFNPARNGTAVARAAAGDPGYSQLWTQKVNGFIAQPLALQESAQAAANAIAQTQEVSESEGQVSDLQSVTKEGGCTATSCPIPPRRGESPQAVAGSDVADLSILKRVSVPVSAKIGQVRSGIQAETDLNTNLASVSGSNLKSPVGQTELLRNANQPRPQQPGNGQASVQGVQSAGETEGRVAGEITVPQLFDEAPPLGVPQVLPHGEESIGHFLAALKGQARCGCAIEKTANAYGTVIINRINHVSL